MADSLAAGSVEPLLTGRLGRPYLYRATCESVERLLDSALPEGAVAACDEETAARGRLGRTWEAPAGTAVLCAVLLRPPRERRVAELELVASVAVSEAVEAALGLSAQIKWPNDVMVNRRKVASALAESRDGAVVLTIRVNVNQRRSQLPDAARVPAASLLTTDTRHRTRAPILADVLRRLEHAYEAWCRGGLDALYVGLGARDFLRGRKVTVDGRAGLAVAIDRGGRLEVDAGGERLLVESADVAYQR